MLLIINGATVLVTVKDERVLVYVLKASLSLSGLICHRRKLPFVVHIISRCPPEQTDATPGGDIVTVPIHEYYTLDYITHDNNCSSSLYSNLYLLATGAYSMISSSMIMICMSIHSGRR